MRIFINVMLLLVLQSVSAQHKLSGTVTDDQNNPLEFVSIYLPQLEKGTTTDDNGNFTIKNLPTGSYDILFSYIGFETLSKSITFPTEEQLFIQMTVSAVEMKEVIVSTPFHKLQSENVMKVEQEKVSNLKAQGASTLAEGITNIVGVSSITTGAGIGKPVIRGLSTNRVLVYAQGVRLENQQWGGEHGLGVSDAGIESVEVIKGPASLLYGSDALGGVLYLNPERFADSNTTQGDVNTNYFSNTQGFSTNAGVKTSSEKYKFLLRGSYAQQADYKTPDYRVTNTRFKEYDLKTGIGYQSANFKTEFRYNLNSSDLGIPEEIGIQSTKVTPLLPYQQINNHIFSSKSTAFFENSKLDINLGYTYNDRKEFEEHHHNEDHEHEGMDEDEHEHEEDDENTDEASLYMKLKTFNYDLKYHLPELGKFETIVGVQGMDQTNTNYGEELLIPDARTNDFGILATSHIHFEKMDVQLGARFDNRTIDTDDFNKSYNSFNGAAGAKTNLSDYITVRLNLATGFRAPNLAELASDGNHFGANRYEVGNQDLDYEQNFQTDFDLEFKNDHWEIFVNGFYNLVSNYIYLQPNGEFIDNDPVYVYQQNDASLYGGEFGLHFHPHPLDWLHVESSFETVTGKQNSGYLPLIPANTLKNTLRVEFNNDSGYTKYAFVKLQSTFEQNNVSDFETSTDGYNLLSAGLGGNLKLFKKDLSLTVVATNIMDKKYINHLSRLKTDGIYNMGRNISLGIKYEL
ncbi:TonB-dependent receptor [Mangrovimonas aestuarii]|uniref:TonB-dependent receptor n=1 Tax=Mangrovimonas aestuarii TaxID=3018443 RepID=UPI002377F7B7|nr:TonB-dependent receptor [Mangrovimonas aestuarii]